MILWLYIAALAIASYFFWRLLGIVVHYLTKLAAQVGGKIHATAKLVDGEETNAWLLSLLLGITRYPTLILGTGGFFFFTLHYIYEPFFVLITRDFTVNAFFFLLVVRLLGVVMGSVMYGESVKTVISSLEA